MNNQRPISIAILGGMGPQASALLHSRLLTACTNELGITDCHKFPLITHVSIPARGFISNPDIRHQNRPLIERAIRIINHSSPDIAVIACNTAHLLINEVPALGKLPLIELPDSVVRLAAASGTRQLGVIASPTTIRSKLYDPFAHRNGLQLIVPSNEDCLIVEQIIRETIAGKNGINESAALEGIIRNLQSMGADNVALCCTELSVAMQERQEVVVIDSISATVTSIIERLHTLQAGRMTGITI